MNKYEKFMLESNRIEGEDRINPGDMEAMDFTIKTRLQHMNQILVVHNLLGAYLKKSWVGKWRDCDVWVGGHECPDPMIIPDLMEKYMRSSPEMKSWEAHNEFEYIHPFQDLNGRTGRLIWLARALSEGYDFQIPFLQRYYYQTLQNTKGE